MAHTLRLHLVPNLAGLAISRRGALLMQLAFQHRVMTAPSGEDAADEAATATLAGVLYHYH